MSFEIDRPVHFLPQATYIKEDLGFPALDFTHHQHHTQPNDSIVYSPNYSAASSANNGVKANQVYNGLPPYNPSSSTFSSVALPMSSLVTTPSTTLYEVGTSYHDLENGSLTSPTSISSSSRSNKEGHQQEALSPLPTNTSMYAPQFTQRNEVNTKPLTPSIEMIQQQQQQQQQQHTMNWKEDLYSPPVSTNGPWSQQSDDIYYPTTPTPRSSSCSPSHQHRNMPPCNCVPMMQYAPIYNGPNTTIPPYHGASSTMGLTSPPSHQQYPSYQRSFMDPSYDPTLDLSPSSSSSLSDDYHHHQAHYRRYRHSMSTNSNTVGTHPTLTSSSSSSSSSSSNRTTTNSATTPRRYKCTVCVKRFTRPSSLATHMHSHTGEKPYKCIVDGCGRRFSVVSNLRRHAKIHLHANSMVGASGRKLDLTT